MRERRRTSPAGGQRMHPSLRDAEPAVFWLDTPDAPEPGSGLTTGAATDLLIVGAGYTGLWAAIQAKERDPDRDVLVVEGDSVAAHASGRNGGFVDASITHGLANGVAHFPDEVARLEALGRENFAAIAAAIEAYGIDARFEPNGGLHVATAPWQVADLRADLALLDAHGVAYEWLERDALRACVASPTYEAGVRIADGQAIVDPARLAWGLADVARSLGVRIAERTRAVRIDSTRTELRVATSGGTVRARAVLLATNARSHLVRATRRRVVPVWDYVLVSEPLGPAQRDAIGWRGREGISDAANQFHYYRLTADDRILWGGYDAVYYRGGDIAEARSQRMATFAVLARHFFATFPQLEGMRFTHRWGGVIDTSSRFCVTFGRAHQGRVSYAVGYTGLGVAASRFGARVALDLLDEPGSDLTRLEFVRRAPFPFPPEPLRSAAIAMTRRAIARADDHGGRRGAWLRLLDAFGVGFDS
jgi:glycine/D-amino acid oxidase-like deaminating enzyme